LVVGLGSASCGHRKRDRFGQGVTRGCDADALFSGREFFVPAIARFDFDAGRGHLFCDSAPGKELILVRRTGFVDSTEKGGQVFMYEKARMD